MISSIIIPSEASEADSAFGLAGGALPGCWADREAADAIRPLGAAALPVLA